jgi:hypothetical protein
MESLPSHIRPEDTVDFLPPLPLTKMRLRSQAWLGLKVLIAVQILLMPLACFSKISGWLTGRWINLPDSVVILAWVGAGLLELWWAASIFRHWVASALGQKMIRDIIEQPTQFENRT